MCEQTNTLKNSLHVERQAKEGLENKIKVIKTCEEKAEQQVVKETLDSLHEDSKEIEHQEISNDILDKYNDIIHLDNCISQIDPVLDKEISIKYLPVLCSDSILSPFRFLNIPSQESEMVLTDSLPIKNKEEQNPVEKQIRTLDITKESDLSVDDSFSEDTDFDNSPLPLINNYNLLPAEKLSIPRVYDVREDKYIEAREFFNRDESELILYRRTLQECITMNKPRFICPECRQPVKISGHKFARGRVCYFAHYKDSNECKYKTGTNRTKEEIERQKYSLVQESLRHQKLKKAIESALKGEKSREMGVCSVECEKHITGDIPYLNYRRPDVYAEYKGKRLVFELQLSTTFLSVIVERDLFYRLNDINIIWIFNFEDNQEYVNLQNLMCKDIYYANKRNIFIFDEEVKEQSQKEGKLILKCRWLDENGIWSTDQKVSLDDLIFDDENNKPYVFDADLKYLEKYPEKALLRKELEHSRSEILSSLIKRQEEERIQLIKTANRRAKLQDELLSKNLNVTLFKKGNKYGYQYKGEIIVSPQYTSAEAIQESGYARVGFNRKYGLIRRDGKEIVPIEYKTIEILDHVHGLVIAYYKDILLCIGEEKFLLVNEYDEKEQSIEIIEEDDVTKYILITQQYNYSYTRSYYGDHPICHKSNSGSIRRELFSIKKDAFGCLIWINNELKYIYHNKTYTLPPTIFDCYLKVMFLGLDGFFLVQNPNKEEWYVINISGNKVSTINYENVIPCFDKYLFIKRKNEHNDDVYGIIDYRGDIHLKPSFTNVFHLKNNLFAFEKDNLWGICNEEGTIWLPPMYTIIKKTSSEDIMVSSFKGFSKKWSVKETIPSYNEMFNTPHSYLCQLNNKGHINYSEEERGNYIIRKSSDIYAIFKGDTEIIGYELSSIELKNENIGIVKDLFSDVGILKDDKCIIFSGCSNIDFLTEETFALKNEDDNYAIGNLSGRKTGYEFKQITVINSSRFIASGIDKEYYSYGRESYIQYSRLYDNEGNSLSQKFTDIGEFKNGVARVKLHSREGFMNLNGELQESIKQKFGNFYLYDNFGHLYFKDKEGNIISAEYDIIEPLDDYHFKVKNYNDQYERIYSIIERKLSEVMGKEITVIENGVFQVVIKEDMYGEKIKNILIGITPLFDQGYINIQLLDNKFWAVQDYDSGNWGLTSFDGKFKTDFRFNKIIKCYPDRFEIEDTDNNIYFINLRGEAIVEKVKVPNTDLTINQNHGKFSLLTNVGETILPADFREIKYLTSGLLIVRKESLWALYNINGEQKTSFSYNDIICGDDGKIVATKKMGKED
ncbi:MAG: competence protein CoiA [Muribaculaceae bacterium]|nr:competence protein CoiA [Muribaculaceae bacterium]